MASNRSLWMALGAGLLAGASIAAYRARQRARRSAVGPEYLDRWRNEASSDLPGMSAANSGAGLGSSTSGAARSPLGGNGPAVF